MTATGGPRHAFEDFAVGGVTACGPRMVTTEEIVAFASQFDPQPFHVDEDAAARSIYGGLIASGWHTCCLAMRMACDAFLLDSTSMGSPGLDEVRWLLPVRAGDTIRLEIETLESRPSRSKPDRGVVVSQWRVYNQHDELTTTMRGMALFMSAPRDVDSVGRARHDSLTRQSNGRQSCARSNRSLNSKRWWARKSS